jgi:hypothetical protein
MRLAGALWADGSGDCAARSLRTALWRIRQVGANLVLARDDRLRLYPGVTVDVTDLTNLALRLIHQPDPGGLSQLPLLVECGELLPDWEDDGVVADRERYRLLRLEALERAALTLMERRQLGDALIAALAAAQTEPLRESARRLVVQVQVAQGNVAEAGAAAGGAAAEPSITAHQRRALRLAVSQKGPKEILGKNCNPYSRWFGFGCQEWCADFVSFCIDRTGDRDHTVPWGYPSAVANISAWGQRNRRIFSQPQKGDIFTRKDGGHTGFVTSVHGSSFMTIEGNTTGPDGNPDHAVYVFPHQRDASDGLYYFVRWHF